MSSFLNEIILLKRITLALMETASFCAGVRHKRYSGQQELAPNNTSTSPFPFSPF